MTDSMNQVPNLTHVSQFVSIKLDDENYPLWKYQFITLLKTMGLMNFIDENVSAPSRDSVQYPLWERMDGYVSACLNATIHPSLAHLAISTTTSSQLWKLIEETQHQNENVFAKKKLQLRMQFQTIKQGTSSISDYCDSLERISNALRSTGDPISDSAVVLQTIQGLNQAYNPFILTIENLPELPTFIQLKAKLLVYEERLAQQTTEIKCQICMRDGHDASRGGRDGGGSADGENPNCFAVNFGYNDTGFAPRFNMQRQTNTYGLNSGNGPHFNFNYFQTAFGGNSTINQYVNWQPHSDSDFNGSDSSGFRQDQFAQRASTRTQPTHTRFPTFR